MQNFSFQTDIFSMASCPSRGQKCRQYGGVPKITRRGYLIHLLAQRMRLKLADFSLIYPVTFTTFLTGSLSPLIEFQLMSIFTHPAGLSCRISHHQGVIGDLFCNNRSGSDKGKL